MRRLALIGAVVVSMSACVSTNPRGGFFGGNYQGTAGQDGFGPLPVTARYNGISLAAIPQERMPADATRPHIRTKSDIAASDKLIKFYGDLSWKAFAAQDYETFTAARSIATYLARARMAQNLTTAMLTHSFAANNSVAILPASSVGFLPNKLYAEKSGRRAVLDIGDIEFAHVTPDAESEPIKLAAGPGFFGAGTGRNDYRNGQKTSEMERNGWGKNSQSIFSMPVGSAFLATNKEGQKFIVENTQDGFLFYNTGSEPVRVNLEDLDYFPVLDEPSPVRRKATPIVRNIADSIDSLLLPLLARGDLSSNAYATLPSQFVITSYPPIRRDLDANGLIATTKTESDAGKRASLTNPAFKLAMTMMGSRRFETKEANEFSFKCGGGRTKRIRYEGDSLEFIRFSCMENNQLIYTQRMIVLDDMTFKTYASLREDQRLAERVKAVMNNASLVEAIASFLPAIGQVDAGARCLGQEAPSVTATRIYNHFFRPESYKMGVENFVKDLIPDNGDPAFINQALDCSLVGGGVGATAKGLAAAKTGYAEFAKNGRLNKVLDVMSMFDQSFVKPGGIAETRAAFELMDRTFGAGANAAKVVKTFYETAQGSMGITSLAENVMQNQALKEVVATLAR